MPTYKARIVVDVTANSPKNDYLESTLTGKKTKILEFEINADNQYQAKNQIEAQYKLDRIILLTEKIDRDKNESTKKYSTKNNKNKHQNTLSYAAGQALGNAIVGKGRFSGFLRVMMIIGVGIVVTWFLF